MVFLVDLIRMCRNYSSFLCRETRIWCTEKNRGQGLWRSSDPLQQGPPPYQLPSPTTGVEPCPGGSRTRSHSQAPAVASELCPPLGMGNKYRLTAEKKKDECVIYLKILKKKRKKELKEREPSDSDFSDKESFDNTRSLKDTTTYSYQQLRMPRALSPTE